MSGIVGIVNLDGALVDRELIQQMTHFMRFRGPDAEEVWIDGKAGFGHAMLRTTSEQLAERQPCSLDGQVWITADARVDARADLIEELRSKGRYDLKNATDAELILYAYHVWGEDSVKHLLGDFAFAIWDARRQRLFCARDHLGVKPFYYARLANCFVFSNTLDCVRLYPGVSDKLNDLAIADFLLFGMNKDPAATTFADIQRLPPAHTLIVADGVARMNRYWRLPTNGEIRFKRASDYVERFKELLRASVNDRLRTDRVGIFMSGGLDSTAIAATARELLERQGASFDVRAYACVYDGLILDQERHYSGLTAKALGIPIHYAVGDQYAPYERWDRPELRRPEPPSNPMRALGTDLLRQAAAHGRVALDGYDGDTILAQPMPTYFRALLKHLRLGRVVADFVGYVRSERQVPALGILGELRRRIRREPPPRGLSYPTWLNQSFAKRLDLPARWKEIKAEPRLEHPTHPDAYRSLRAIPRWVSLFESFDAGVSQIPLEMRHPFVDLRLVNYSLAIPTVPWCVKKNLLREAMRGVLPEQVLLRPKTPLAGDPVVASLKRSGAEWSHHFNPSQELAQYADRDAIPTVTEIEDTYEVCANLRPISLDYWFKYMMNLPAQRPEKKNEN